MQDMDPKMQEVYRRVQALTILEVSDQLKEKLPPELVDYITQRSVSMQESLQATLVAMLLLEVDDSETIVDWFMSMNLYLEDKSPARALHEGKLDDAIRAARIYTVYGE